MTPWGPAVNLDQPGSDEVRAFLIGNALMWLRDYHLDGLRLDAVHALDDHRALHFLEELATEVDALAALLNRALILIAESDTNDPRLVTSREAGGYGLAAQWSDDFHHALHAAITGERQGYYCDFGSLGGAGQDLHPGLLPRRHLVRLPRPHPRPAGRRPRARPTASSATCRTTTRSATGPPATGSPPRSRPSWSRSAPALVLTSPFTPMLFMGEEWGAVTPWQYFTDHTDRGWPRPSPRAARPSSPSTAGTRPTCPTPRTRRRSAGPSWTGPSRDRTRTSASCAWYRELIALRRSRPELVDPRLNRVQADFDEDARWLLVRRGRLRIVANLGTQPARLPLGQRGTGVLAASSPGVTITQDTVTMPPATFAVIETRALNGAADLRPQPAARPAVRVARARLSRRARWRRSAILAWASS